MALGSLLHDDGLLRTAEAAPPARGVHFAPKAKSVIYLFMAGGPSQFELFDFKPKLQELDGKVIPQSYVENQRFAFNKKDEKLMATRRAFGRHGQSGQELSECLPHIASIPRGLVRSRMGSPLPRNGTPW